uniref:Uncharacterized protein n=1 Tax=Oncorhynchus kisutch TaxID=8019 RepID=A0A8C7H585_ONCKI
YCSQPLTWLPVCYAEVIRVRFKDQGAEFDKNVVTMEITQENRILTALGLQFFGQLPKFEDCGLTLYQINVVKRHLAQKLGRWRNNIKACLQHNDIPIDSPIMCNMSRSISDSGKEEYLKALNMVVVGREGLRVVLDWDFSSLILLLIHHQVLSLPCFDAFPSFQKYTRRLCARPNLPIIPGKRA